MFLIRPTCSPLVESVPESSARQYMHQHGGREYNGHISADVYCGYVHFYEEFVWCYVVAIFWKQKRKKTYVFTLVKFLCLLILIAFYSFLRVVELCVIASTKKKLLFKKNEAFKQTVFAVSLYYIDYFNVNF